jgi:hypothetical protein
MQSFGCVVGIVAKMFQEVHNWLVGFAGGQFAVAAGSVDVYLVDGLGLLEAHGKRIANAFCPAKDSVCVETA